MDKKKNAMIMSIIIQDIPAAFYFIHDLFDQ